MAPWIDIPLATQQGEGLSPYVSDAGLVNLMLHPNPPGSAKPFHILNTPGLSTFSDSINSFTSLVGAGGAKIRGVCAFDGHVFIVAGTAILTYDGRDFATIAATMPGTAYCRMVDAGTHLVIVDGTNARCLAATTHASTTPTTEGWCDVAYIDGYTIYLDTGSNQVFASNLDDPTTIGALNFTTADALPGNVVGCVADHRELVVFKKTSTEFYYNDGSSGFPLARSSPGMMERGCYAARSIAKHQNSVFFLGDDLRIYALQGYAPRPISSPWIEKILQDTGLSAIAHGSVFTHEGRAWYSLAVGPSGNVHNMFYDIDAGLWHERVSGLSANGYYSSIVNMPYSSYSSTAVPALAAVGTDSAAFVYKLDSAAYRDTNDNGASSVSRIMTLPPIVARGRRMFMPELILDAETASAASTIDLQWSDDGSSNFTTTGTHNGDGTRSVVNWNRLGSFRKTRTLRFTFSTNSRVAIHGVRARPEGAA